MFFGVDQFGAGMTKNVSGGHWICSSESYTTMGFFRDKQVHPLDPLLERGRDPLVSGLFSQPQEAPATFQPEPNSLTCLTRSKFCLNSAPFLLVYPL